RRRPDRRPRRALHGQAVQQAGPRRRLDGRGPNRRASTHRQPGPPRLTPRDPPLTIPTETRQTMPSSSTTPEPNRRDDLILMLLHGGAASPAIAERVVDTYQAEVLLAAASKVIARVKPWDGMSAEAESLNR